MASRPFTGAWIETWIVPFCVCALFVAPSRGRGLKHAHSLRSFQAKMVAPSRGRGLKPGSVATSTRGFCRPFTGAWIETIVGAGGVSLQPCRPFTGAWIETYSCIALNAFGFSRPFTGAWIETFSMCLTPIKVEVAPSRGRGLKLWSRCCAWADCYKSPLHGGVD